MLVFDPCSARYTDRRKCYDTVFADERTAVYIVWVPQVLLNHVFVCRSSIIIFSLLLSMSWYMRNALTERQAIKLPFLFNVVAFLGLYLVHAVLVGADLRASVWQASFTFICVSSFFYFIIAWVRDEVMLRRIIKVMAVSCVVQAILSFFSYYYYVGFKGESIYSFSGFLRDYELFAEYLAIHVPLLIFVIRHESGKAMKRVFTAGLALIIFVLIATVIRGAISSLVLGMAYYFFHLRKIERISRIAGIIVLGVGICSLGLFAVYHLLPQSARIIERFIATDLSTLDTRRYVWLAFFDLFKEKPILGHGMFYNLPTAGFFWPHSTYFYYLMTTGVLGLGNYVFLLFRLMHQGWENLRRNQHNPVNFELAVALNSAFVIFVLDGLKVGYQRYSNYQLFIWLLFALIAALHNMKSGRQREWRETRNG